MLHCILGLLYTLLALAVVCGVLSLIAVVCGWPADPTTWPIGRWPRIILLLIGVILAVLFIACVFGQAPAWWGFGWVGPHR